MAAQHLPDRGGQEVGDGPHRDCAFGLHRGPHDRQPPPLRGATGDPRIRRDPAGSGHQAPAPHLAAVDHAHRADHRLRPAHPLGLFPQPNEHCRRPALSRRPQLHRSQLRLPHHAVDRPHHRAVPLLPPGRSHLGLVQPRLRAGRPLPQRVGEPEQHPGSDPLHRGQHRAGRPHLPRHLEHVPEPGGEQPPLQPPAPLPGRRAGRDHPGGQPELPHLRAGRGDRRQRPLDRGGAPTRRR